MSGKEFQLGHVFSDMEMNTDIIVHMGYIVFQLGHVFSDMEIAFSSFLPIYENSGVSIGPRLFRHGNSCF